MAHGKRQSVPENNQTLTAARTAGPHPTVDGLPWRQPAPAPKGAYCANTAMRIRGGRRGKKTAPPDAGKVKQGHSYFTLPVESKTRKGIRSAHVCLISPAPAFIYNKVFASLMQLWAGAGGRGPLDKKRDRPSGRPLAASPHKRRSNSANISTLTISFISRPPSYFVGFCLFVPSFFSQREQSNTFCG